MCSGSKGFEENDDPGLTEFCQFVSGAHQYLRHNPKTPSCRNMLPVTHFSVTSSCFQEFKKNMDIALKFEASGFYIM